MFYVVNRTTDMWFLSGDSNQVIKVNIQGDWDPDRLVKLVRALGVPMEEKFSEIGMNVRISVFHL